MSDKVVKLRTHGNRGLGSALSYIVSEAKEIIKFNLPFSFLLGSPSRIQSDTFDKTAAIAVLVQRVIYDLLTLVL